ncbi:sodium/proline symporter [Bdellovibrionota bacterium]
MQPVTIGFIVYLVFIFCVGLYTVRFMKNIKDFALGGNRLGPVVIAFSERASGESAWLLIGLPGAALTAGLLELWTVLGCITGASLSWFVIAKRLRVATGEHGAITLPELFAKRFKDKKGYIQLLASLIITFFFTFYVSAQFHGAGKVLNVTFGLDHFHGMLLGAGIIIFYTLLGGFFAVAWTDVIQGIIMIGTLVILPIVGFIELSGHEYSGAVWDASTLFGGEVGFGALIGAVAGLSWGLGYIGQPHLVTRFMAIDKAENIKVGRRIAVAWVFPAFFGSMFIGLVGAKLIAAGVIPAYADPEKLMPEMANLLLPSWVAGIFISGAIAAMMSTADSQLLVSTTVLTEDIIGRFFRKQIGKLKLLTIGRILTIFIGIIAFYLAWHSTELVFETVSYAWGGLGASFGPALLLTLWWKRTSKAGVISGMIAGTLFTIVDISGGAITPRLTAFVLAFVAVTLFSVLFPDKK